MYFRFLTSLVLFIVVTSATALGENLAGVVGEQILDYPDGSHRIVKLIQTAEGRNTPIDFSKIKEDPERGTYLEVEGQYVQKEFIVSRIISRAKFASSATAELSSGSFKVVTILVNFAGLPTPCSVTEVESVLYTDTPSVQGQLEASSRGKNSLERDGNGDGFSDIFGPYTIAAPVSVCDPDTWAKQAEAAARAAGVNLSLYDLRLYVLPDYPDLPCGWSGLGSLGCVDNPFFTCQVWLARCDDGPTYMHEFGHNYGMQHSSIDPDNDGTIVSGDAYRDHSCPMGNGSYWNLFNAPHQDQMGWLDDFPGAVVEASASGTFSIAPLEVDPGSSALPLVIKIPHFSGENYYLSYRRDLGSYGEFRSSYEDKLSIHRYSGSDDDRTRLITNLSLGQVFQDLSGLSLKVLSINTSSLTFEIEAGSNAPQDSDGDGVFDATEIVDGSHPSDPGSFLMRLESPVHTLWNGFLGMVNIIEMVNPSETSSTEVKVDLYRLDGTLGSSQIIGIGAGQQFDLVLNAMEGFTADSYGVVKLTYEGELDGRVSYYRNGFAGDYEFAYSVPLENATTGESAVGFNTFQPSQNPLEAGFQVYNWLTVVNLSSSTQSFTVYTYDQGGNVLAERALSLPSFGRSDIDGGHDLAGASTVGLHRIVPDNPNAEYVGQLIRYGSNAPVGGAATGFYFAFPLSARKGSGQPQRVHISNAFGEENWVEISNTRSSAVNVSLQFYNELGILIFTEELNLPAYGQLNFPTAGYLGSAGRGYAEITPSTTNSVVAQTMYYFRDPMFGSMRGMYGSATRESLGSTLTGSYNLFLNMQNYLRVSNTTSEAVVATVEVVSEFGTYREEVSLAPRGTRDLLVYGGSYNTQANTYGFVRLTSTHPRSLIAELLRLRVDLNGIDFVFPTSVRP